VVCAEFAVALKLNCADFQRGGFTADDAKKVFELLNDLGVVNRPKQQKFSI
jgi:hypothetical protein